MYAVICIEVNVYQLCLLLLQPNACDEMNDERFRSSYIGFFRGEWNKNFLKTLAWHVERGGDLSEM